MTEIAVLPKDELMRLIEQTAQKAIETVSQRIAPPPVSDNAPAYLHRAIWNAQECADYLGVHPSTFSRLKIQPDFPAPIHIEGIKGDRWRAEDIRQWVRTRRQES